MTKSDGKSCFNCVNSKDNRFQGIPGTKYEPPLPPAAKCSHPPDWIEDAYRAAKEADCSSGLEFYQLVAENCSLYWPEKVGHCANCRKYISKPLYSWKIWAQTWKLTPVCSEECGRELENEFREWLENTITGAALNACPPE